MIPTALLSPPLEARPVELPCLLWRLLEVAARRRGERVEATMASALVWALADVDTLREMGGG